MKMRCLLLVFIISVAVISAAAQVKTVTNADLAKYKQERVKAEVDLRENYAKLGFPSPAELDRRNAQSAKETAELSAKLRTERLLAEQAAAEVERLRGEQARYAAYQRPVIYERSVQDTYYPIWGYGSGRLWPGWRMRGTGITWRADASGVVYEPGGRSSNIWTPVFTPVWRR